MRLVIGFALVLSPILMFSQIVNVESKRSGKKEEGWNGSIDLNFSLTRNTSDVLSYGGKTSNQYLKNRHRYLLLADLNRVQAGGDIFVNQGYEHLRYNYEFGEEKRLAAEVFQQAQFNSVQKIKFRHLSGAGLRYAPINQDSLKVWAGSILMYEYEELTTAAIQRNFRQSSYLLFYVAFKKFEFQTINYYQPKWGDFSDFRVSTSSTVEFGVLKWLRFTTGFELLYDSEVPEEVPAVVFSLKNGLRLEF
ncbi:MAG: DUF481 domain-containing protein [Salibacteraceae bacterium]